MEEQEIWKAIPGLAYYEVSNLGRVKSYKRNREYLLKIHLNRGGYPYVRIYNDGQGCTKMIHVLVMLTFVGPRPNGMDICHEDNNPQNNRLSNLRYDTHLQNMRDAARAGRKGRLSRVQVEKIIQLYLNGMPPKQIAGLYKISPEIVYHILKGRIYRCYTENITPISRLSRKKAVPQAGQRGI